jgi:DNA invertase Pin-like site-specific DNA recombinase
MQTTKRPVAIAYYRVSTDQQGKSGLGLADQERSIRAFCEQRGLTLEAQFTEIESGKNDARPQPAKAISFAKRKGGLLVVATLSRLGRRVSFVSGMMDAGTPFPCADAPDHEPFILHVKASFAEEEARKISQRTKAALAIKKAQGAKLGNPENLTLDAHSKGAATNKARARPRRTRRFFRRSPRRGPRASRCARSRSASVSRRPASRAYCGPRRPRRRR